MQISINLMGVEILSLTFSFPRLGVFVPGDIPASAEAYEILMGENDD
jgi:hypothetical protein